MNLRKRGDIYHVWYERSAQYPNGKLLSLKTGDKDEAAELFRLLKKAWHESRVIELDHGRQIKLSKLVEEYLKDRQDLSPDTLRMDDLAIRMLIAVVGDVWAKSLNDALINKFKAAYKAKGKSNHSVNAYLRHIRAIMRYAYEKGYVKRLIKIKSLKVGKHLPRIITKEEREKILAKARTDNFEMLRIITFALYTGCRRAEIKSLRWQHLDLNANTCRITGKGDRQRTLYLLPEAVAALGEIKAIGPVFFQHHIDFYSKSFKKIAVDCGIKDIHFHNLRHSAATQMVESGIPLEIIQKILGHSDIRTTQIYAQIFDEVVAKQMQKLKY